MVREVNRNWLIPGTIAIILTSVITAGCIDDDDYIGVALIVPLKKSEFDLTTEEIKSEMIEGLDYKRVNIEDEVIRPSQEDTYYKPLLSIEKVIDIGVFRFYVQEAPDNIDPSNYTISAQFTTGNGFNVGDTETEKEYQNILIEEIRIIFDELNWTLNEDHVQFMKIDSIDWRNFN